MNNTQTSSAAVTFPGLTTILTVIFTIAKLLGKITWSWWWVLSPVWISAGIFVVVLVVAFAIAILVAACRS